jgi:hypothetical protein
VQEDNQETFYEKLWKSQEEEPMKMTSDEVCSMALRREKLSVRTYWVLLGVTLLFLAAFVRDLLHFRDPG